MSAYVCNDSTINRIVSGLTFAKAHGDYGRTMPKPSRLLCEAIGTAQELGATLYSMNINAVEQRYPDCVGNPNNLPGQVDDNGNHKPYSFSSVLPPTTAQLYKDLNEYLYQCSEGDVDELPLYAMLDSFVNKIARIAFENSEAYRKATA